MASHMQSSLAFRTISNPEQQEPSGFVFVFPSLKKGMQSAIPYITSSQSSKLGEPAVVGTSGELGSGDGAYDSGLTTWIRAQFANIKHVVKMNET
ncbi:hypothetical protein ACFX2F_044110 [Malus domestica]